MPSQSYSHMLNDRPDLARILDHIQHFVENHVGQTFTLEELVFNWPDRELDAFKLAQALIMLTKLGKLKMSYSIKKDNGTIIDNTYNSPREIPDWVEDHYGEPFRSEDATLVQLYERVG